MPHTEQNAELRTIVLLFLAMFVSGTETLIVNPILPQLASALSVEVDRAARVVTVYASSAGFDAFLFGPISDRAHRKHMLVLSLLVLGLGTVIWLLGCTEENLRVNFLSTVCYNPYCKLASKLADV
jgi:predicted MFS family arabinose efflux permease